MFGGRGEWCGPRWAGKAGLRDGYINIGCDEGWGVEEIESGVLSHHFLSLGDDEVLGYLQISVELKVLVGEKVEPSPLSGLVEVPAFVEVVLLVAES